MKRKRRTKAEMEELRKHAAEVCDACAQGVKVPARYHGLDCPIKRGRK